jgi:hypothetical protein
MADNRTAIEICHTCRWEQDCRRYALNHLVEGIWGGTTVPERRRLRQKYGIKAQPMMLILSDTTDAIRARERRAQMRGKEIE